MPLLLLLLLSRILPIMITMEMINIIMILIIIITKKEILVEHELFSIIPSTKPNPHYFDSQESYVALLKLTTQGSTEMRPVN